MNEHSNELSVSTTNPFESQYYTHIEVNGITTVWVQKKVEKNEKSFARCWGSFIDPDDNLKFNSYGNQ